MKDPTGMLCEPFLNLGVFVGSVVVGDGVDDLASGHDPFHAVEELDEFLMSMAGHAAANHGSIENVHGREQGRRAVALVVMGHSSALSRL